MIRRNDDRTKLALVLKEWSDGNRLKYSMYISGLGLTISIIMLIFDRIFIPDSSPFLKIRLIGLILFLGNLYVAKRLHDAGQSRRFFSSMLLCIPVFIYAVQYLFFTYGIDHGKFFVYFVGNLLGAFCGSWIIHRFREEQYLFNSINILSLLIIAFTMPQHIDSASILIIVHIVGANVAIYSRRDFAKTLLRDSIEEHRKLEMIEQDYMVYKSIAASTQMVAHDIMKPFANLRTILHQMRFGDIQPEKLAQYSRYVEIAARDIEEMLSDLLLIGSRRSAKIEVIDLPALVEEVWQGLTEFNVNWSVFRFTRIFNHKNPIQANRVKLKRVLTNLLKNAVEASEPASDQHVWVKSMESSDVELPGCRIVVGNVGSVIAKDDMIHIFNRFYTQGKEHGTGLGLAISYELAAQCGARLVCNSSTEEGTEFAFVLPNDPFVESGG